MTTTTTAATTLGSDRIHLEWPPPPHDPRERQIAMTLRDSGWEVRLFDENKFRYFVTRGFWHLQLWHPDARVSILSPSRLTSGFYEMFPNVDRWKSRVHDYDELTRLVTVTPLPSHAQMRRIERAFVEDIVIAAAATSHSARLN